MPGTVSQVSLRFLCGWVCSANSNFFLSQPLRVIVKTMRASGFVGFGHGSKPRKESLESRHVHVPDSARFMLLFPAFLSFLTQYNIIVFFLFIFPFLLCVSRVSNFASTNLHLVSQICCILNTELVLFVLLFPFYLSLRPCLAASCMTFRWPCSRPFLVNE